jgi:TPR repeat protein
MVRSVRHRRAPAQPPAAADNRERSLTARLESLWLQWPTMLSLVTTAEGTLSPVKCLVLLGGLLVAANVAWAWHGIAAGNEYAEMYDWKPHHDKAVTGMVGGGADTVFRVRRAAEKGSPKAQMQLADSYRLGNEGVQRSFSEAVLWYGRAAEQEAQPSAAVSGVSHYWLGYYLSRGGAGVTKDLVLAAAHMGKAAGHKLAYAQFALGEMHQYGQGVPINVTAAIESYNDAANQGHTTAQFAIGRFYEKLGRYTDAADMYRKAALENDGDAQTALGLLYMYGHGVHQDSDLAAQWFQAAVDTGDAEAAYMLAHRYRKGDGVPQDPLRAVELLRAASSKSRTSLRRHNEFPVRNKARHSLGSMYESGNGVEKHARKAFQWYQLAARKGHADSQFRLGRMLAIREVCVAAAPELTNMECFTHGRTWIRKAGLQGHEDALTTLAKLDPEWYAQMVESPGD